MTAASQRSRRKAREAFEAQPENSKPRLLKKISKKVGMPPGSLVHVGEQRVEQASIRIMDYGEDGFHERRVDTPADCREYLGRSTVTWIDVVGLHDTRMIEELGNLFGIHPLVLEDIVNTGQRPKMEDHLDYLYMTVKMLYLKEGRHHCMSEQVSLILGSNYLVSFQELPEDVFGPVRERIRSATGRLRTCGCDYLAYALLDAVVDNYYVVLESLDDRIERLHGEVLDHAGSDVLIRIHEVRREMVHIRKQLWPLREMVDSMEVSDSILIARETKPYLRDVYEHIIQVMDNLESLRDMLTAAMEINLSLVSNRMNDVMRVLTVIATIFIPLTFIAGIYGMNFDHMPELHFKYGYFVAWLAMAGTAVGMVYFFRRRGWL